MADALEYIGEQKIVYRDLKLENVLLSTWSNSVLLADFGLVRKPRAWHALPPRRATPTGSRSFRGARQVQTRC